MWISGDKYFKQSLTHFCKRGTLGYKVAVDSDHKHKINPIKYIIVRRLVVLPYSYFQLMVKATLNNI